MQNMQRVWFGIQKRGSMIICFDIWLRNMIDTKFTDFVDNIRNLRLGLSTDGMNPHSNMSNPYTIHDQLF